MVRIAPDELSFNNPQSWRDIYGHMQGYKSLVKEPEFFGLPPQGVHNIVSTPSNADHSRMRRLLAHAFSDKALKEQEPLITSYVDLLITKLHQQAHGPAKGKVDLMRWYNYTTFDIIGDLALGESFGCLQEEEYHSWVALIFNNIKFGAWLQAARRFPPLTEALGLLMPKNLKRQRAQHVANNKNKVDKRLQLGKDVDRPDFISYILRYNDEKGMSVPEIHSCASVLIVAGSETTATLLSGVTYHLLTNPETYKKLVDEVRTAFKHDADINSSTVSNLPYLLAVLEEGFRIYPPVPCAIPRRTPPEGHPVCGTWIPGNVSRIFRPANSPPIAVQYANPPFSSKKTTVGVNQYAAYHSSSNFTRPYDYVPERWLPSAPAEFASDRKAVVQPFSTGPRNCLGKNLAYLEMRIILARMILNFDLELCKESKGWAEQKIYNLWEKGPLNVRVTERAHA